MNLLVFSFFLDIDFYFGYLLVLNFLSFVQILVNSKQREREDILEYFLKRVRSQVVVIYENCNKLFLRKNKKDGK